MVCLRCCLVLILCLAFPVTGTSANTLQSAFDASGPGEGYDRLVVLDPAIPYSGGLWIHNAMKCCIHGNGAVINLQNAGIRVQDTGSLLDIDHCVLTHGQSGLIYVNSARGTIRNNTVVGNGYGIQTPGGSTLILIENNIIYDNAEYGLYWQEYVEPIVQYNAVWGNSGGDYMHACG